MFLKYFVIAVPILMVAFFNPLISFLSIYTYCTSEMLPEGQTYAMQVLEMLIFEVQLALKMQI